MDSTTFPNFTNTNPLNDTRLDMEVYVMGEMKIEFMHFLGECFKDNFFETLSWGNFRRFQLILSGKKSWINLHFIFLRNEMSADVLINTFKIYEKRNFTLLLYNAHDQKKEKQIDTLYDSLISERNKFYEGILSDESIDQNLKKLSVENTMNELKITADSLKNNLKFLTGDSCEENLVYKIGFYANSTNRKTKNIKRADGNSTYNISNDIFYIPGNEVTSDFSDLVSFLLVEHFKKLKISSGNSNSNSNSNTLNNFIEILKFQQMDESKSSSVSKPKKMMYFIKTIDWLIVIYILSSFYKFIIDNN